MQNEISQNEAVSVRKDLRLRRCEAKGSHNPHSHPRQTLNAVEYEPCKAY